MSQSTPYTLDAVRALHFIDRHYSLDEVRTLCFELGVDYDNLPGEGKKGKARELILSELRRRGLGLLAAQLEHDHPTFFAREMPPKVASPDRQAPVAAPTLDSRQITAVQAAVRAVVVALGSGSERPHWNRVYAGLRRTFGVGSYRDIPAARFEDAIWFLEDWLAEVEEPS